MAARRSLGAHALRGRRIRAGGMAGGPMSAGWDRCAACGAGPDAHGLVSGGDAVAAIRDAQRANQAMTAAWRREAYSTRIDAAHALDAWLDGDRTDMSALEALRDDLLNLPDVPRPADETEVAR